MYLNPKKNEWNATRKRIINARRWLPSLSKSNPNRRNDINNMEIYTAEQHTQQHSIANKRKHKEPNSSIDSRRVAEKKVENERHAMSVWIACRCSVTYSTIPLPLPFSTTIVFA